MLIVEDSREVVDTLVPVLTADGHEVRSAGDGEEGLGLVESFGPDVVLLDVGLPTIDGLEVCRRLRQHSDAYVMMLTSRDDEVDRVVGLSVGADDYVTKPFFPREVAARVSAMSRRPRSATSGAEPDVEALESGDVRVEPDARRATVDGDELTLTKKEFDLLEVLVGRPRVVHTRQMLREAVWGPDWFGDDHVVDVHMGNLRKKLDRGEKPSRIETVRGVGFRMAARD